MRILANTKFGEWTLVPGSDEEDAKSVEIMFAQKPGTRLKFLKADVDGERQKLQFVLVTDATRFAEKFWITGFSKTDQNELSEIHHNCIHNSGGFLTLANPVPYGLGKAVVISLTRNVLFEERSHLSVAKDRA